MLSVNFCSLKDYNTNPIEIDNQGYNVKFKTHLIVGET